MTVYEVDILAHAVRELLHADIPDDQLGPPSILFSLMATLSLYLFLASKPEVRQLEKNASIDKEKIIDYLKEFTGHTDNDWEPLVNRAIPKFLAHTVFYQEVMREAGYSCDEEFEFSGENIGSFMEACGFELPTPMPADVIDMNEFRKRREEDK